MSAFVERTFGFLLRDPEYLWLGLLVPAALGLRLLTQSKPVILFAPAALLRRRRRPADDEGAAAADDPLPFSWKLALLWLPRALQVAALLLLVVALARPARRDRLPLRSQGIDILVCLDISSSMTTNDMDRRRTRLAVARDAADAFIRGRPDDRIGLMTFARYPDLDCPLTRDHDALQKILSDVETVETDSPEDATGIGVAVARAAEVLSAAGSESRVVILLTDGEENVALANTPGEIAPVHAAQLCQQFGVKAYPIVAGTGKPDASGAWVKLDTRAVRHLAERTGGAFHEAPDARAMAGVYERIDRLEKAPHEEPRYVFADTYLGFLIVAVLLLLLSHVLARTVLDVLP